MALTDKIFLNQKYQLNYRFTNTIIHKIDFWLDMQFNFMDYAK